MATLDLIVGANADDGYAQPLPYLSTTGTMNVGVIGGAHWWTFARFDGVTIPAGATIDSCALTVQAAGTVASTAIEFVVHFNDADDPAAPTTWDQVAALALTTGVSWSPTGWTANTDYSSPDLKAALQEVIDQAGWASGNAILLLIKDTEATTSYRQIKGRDTSDSVCPRLAITYTEAATGPEGVAAVNGVDVGDIATIDGVAIGDITSLNG